MKTPLRNIRGTVYADVKALPSYGHRGRDIHSGKAVAQEQPGVKPVKIPKAKNEAEMGTQNLSGFLP